MNYHNNINGISLLTYVEPYLFNTFLMYPIFWTDISQIIHDQINQKPQFKQHYDQ